MPAYNAQSTLYDVYQGIDKTIVDRIILVDDCSIDKTVEIAKELGIETIVHNKNLGYGANQKTCYKEALKDKDSVIVMLHPDNQYDPKLAVSLASMVASGVYDCAIASRVLLNSAWRSKMPRYKYFFNRLLTNFQNLLLKKKLSEYHSGYRAYSSHVLEKIDFESLDNDFIFDNQLLSLICYNNYSIGEISCPCKYFKDMSSISFAASIKYGLGVIGVSIGYFLAKLGFKNSIYK